jgi:hypothetical protein
VKETASKMAKNERKMKKNEATSRGVVVQRNGASAK